MPADWPGVISSVTTQLPSVYRREKPELGAEIPALHAMKLHPRCFPGPLQAMLAWYQLLYSPHHFIWEEHPSVIRQTSANARSTFKFPNIAPCGCMRFSAIEFRLLSDLSQTERSACDFMGSGDEAQMSSNDFPYATLREALSCPYYLPTAAQVLQRVFLLLSYRNEKTG